MLYCHLLRNILFYANLLAVPVPNKVTKGQTVEIRCELKRTGDYANTLYTIRYFQFEVSSKR